MNRRSYKGKNNPFFGKQHTDTTKKVIGDSSRKRVKSPETRLKKSLSMRGSDNHFFGKHHTEKTKELIGNLERGNSYALGTKRSEITKQLIRKNRLNQIFPQKDTKPEKIMQLSLKLERIKFTKHKPIFGQPDIFIEPNICLFIDGCYWHGCDLCGFDKFTKIYRDTVVNHKLTLDGYIVIRIWEHDIISQTSHIRTNIIKQIKQLVVQK